MDHKQHTEARLEDAIVHALCEGGGYRFVDYRPGGDAAGRFDTARALDAVELLGFIQQTQGRPWAALQAIHGEATGAVLV